MTLLKPHIDEDIERIVEYVEAAPDGATFTPNDISVAIGTARWQLAARVLREMWLHGLVRRHGRHIDGHSHPYRWERAEPVGARADGNRGW